MRTLHIGSTAYGTLPAIVDPADGITPVAPSALAALVVKNGSDTADSVTITADGTRVGVYKWSYNPASEVEGDQFSIVFTVTIDSLPYYQTVDLVVVAVERGTDNVSLTAAEAALTDIETNAGTRHTAQLEQHTATQTAVAAIDGGDATAANQQSILAKFASSTVEVVGNVTPGGDVTIYIGDDDIGDDAIGIPVNDPGEALRTAMQADGATAVFGAGRNNSANDITGTITTANITAADGITTIPVEISSASKPSKPANGFEYHIKLIVATKEKVRVEGCLDLRPERASV